MSNPKFSIEDCAIEMHSETLRRTRYDAEKDTFDTRVTVMRAYEMVEAVVNRAYPGRPPGTYVDGLGRVHPIRAPHPESQPVKRLHPITIDALVDADDDVNEITELNPPAPIPVAGEDDPDIDEDVDEATELWKTELLEDEDGDE